MDGARFDALDRRLAGRTTRRTAIKGAVAGLAGVLAGDAGVAAGCPPGQLSKRGQRDCGGGVCAACCADADCDDGNPCTTNTCRDGVCRKAAVTCPPASDQCLVSVCRPNGGGCVEEPVADGTACNDGDACTQTDTCRAGDCLRGRRRAGRSAGRATGLARG